MTKEQAMAQGFVPMAGFTADYLINDHGDIYSIRKGDGLRPNAGRNGYLLVTLFRDGRRIRRTVASLVLETFKGPRPDGHLACHNNDINVDNHVLNLDWKTPEQNVQDRKRNGGYRKKKNACPNCGGFGMVPA